ncbi:unnamed protein product [Acanthosepion pharaonis]|uniref:Fucolectin tachylectin-4 pentraxin-1 domain-containing protein n=1 Tax=Acanthosepion pharaonis TaxID=158019 RepID=A0A812AKR8_ACAPH|nr:unnamed protein product [Sepia pharaonis]
MKCFVCLLLIIYLLIGKKAAKDCRKSMKLLGSNDQYQCNCKDRTFCDFRNNGKCTNSICRSGYGGLFCQKIHYHKYLRRNKFQSQNIFTSNTKEIINSLNITFIYKYRIHLIKINCQSLVSAATITLSIGLTKFCEKKCQQITECQGDANGEYLLIQTTDKISLSNLKVLGCSSFWFGENCDKKCRCANNSECHMMTGNCPMGCESGRSGSDCQKLNYENVALKKTALQSSTYFPHIPINNTCKFNFTASLAVDGNNNQQYERILCAQTQIENNPKWKVDLGKKYNISQMRIYNNKNYWYLSEAEIKVDNQFCNYVEVARKIIDIKCSKILFGRTIEITKKKGRLNICEVEVLQCLHGFYGKRCNNSCPECKNSSCDQWTGQCLLGCALGYQQHFNKTCTVCPVGTFGERCSQICHCRNKKNCNKENRTCITEEFERGYKDQKCQQFTFFIIISTAVGVVIICVGCFIYFK